MHRPFDFPPIASPAAPRRRTLLSASAAAAALALAGCAAKPRRMEPVASSAPGATSGALRFIGEARLPHALKFKGTTVGGLSALDYDPAADLWYALSDDRSELEPARFYTLRLKLSAQGIAAPELVDVVTLRQPAGAPFPSRRGAVPGRDEVADPEGLRFRPQTRTLLWSSEGDARLGLDPFVREMALDGTHLRELPLPPELRMQTPATGPRNNLALEGLATTPDGSGVWAAMEAALVQDGPEPGVGVPGGPCRFTLLNLATGRPVRQIAYLPDAIPQAPVPPNAYADNGVSEVLMLDAHRMLVLERAYMTGVGNSLRLYRIDTRQGSDTLGQPQLRPGRFEPAAKTLVADFSAFLGRGLQRLDNTEGMAWGPALPGGGRSLVFVSDDNFNPRQVTQFAAFEFLEHKT